MEFTERERKFVDRYPKLKNGYIFLFITIPFLALAQAYLIVAQLIPIYLKPFQQHSEIQDFVRSGLLKCFGASFIWIAMMIGFVVGSYFNYRITHRIFGKIRQD